MSWETYEGGTVAEHWIDLESGRSPTEPPDLRASVKWDGCVHLNTYSNMVDPARDDAKVIGDNSHYIHICELEEHIATLQALLAKAREHFGPEWPR